MANFGSFTDMSETTDWGDFSRRGKGPQHMTFARGPSMPNLAPSGGVNIMPGAANEVTAPPMFGAGGFSDGDFGGGDFGGGGSGYGDFLQNYSGGYTPGEMGNWTAQRSIGSFQTGPDGRVSVTYTDPTSVILKGMGLHDSAENRRLAAWQALMQDRQGRDFKRIDAMNFMKNLGLQRELGMGGLENQRYGIDQNTYRTMEGYAQAQREAEMRRELGMRGFDEQAAESLRRHEQVMGLEDRRRASSNAMLDRLLGPGAGINSLIGGAVSSSPTSRLGGPGGSGTPFEDALRQRMGAASAENAADAGQQRMAMVNRATGPGGGLAAAPNADPMLAHSRAMADTQDMQNLRQQLLGEKALGAQYLGALGGLV